MVNHFVALDRRVQALNIPSITFLLTLLVNRTAPLGADKENVLVIKWWNGGVSRKVAFMNVPAHPHPRLSARDEIKHQSGSKTVIYSSSTKKRGKYTNKTKLKKRYQKHTPLPQASRPTPNPVAAARNSSNVKLTDSLNQ